MGRVERSWPSDPAPNPHAERAQALLAVADYLPADTFDGQCRPDGLFGPGTEAAVKQLQLEHGLDPSGVVDDATWDVLLGRLRVLRWPDGDPGWVHQWGAEPSHIERHPGFTRAHWGAGQAHGANVMSDFGWDHEDGRWWVDYDLRVGGDWTLAHTSYAKFGIGFGDTRSNSAYGGNRPSSLRPGTSLRLHVRRVDQDRTKPLIPGVYVYHQGQDGAFGDMVLSHLPMILDEWHHVRVLFNLNDVGRSNGTVRMWWDGTEVITRAGFTNRTVADLRPVRPWLWWNVWRAPHRGWDTEAWVDVKNLTVARTLTDMSLQ
jgi:hypothetical protein